jgi:hypothetical protein
MFKLFGPVTPRVRLEDDASLDQTTLGEGALGFNGHFIKVAAVEQNWDDYGKTH